MTPSSSYTSPFLHVDAMICVLAGIWLGGLIALDLVETPAKFGIKSIDRAAAVELGQEVFHRFGRLEAALALAMTVIAQRGMAAPWLMASTVGLCVLALGVSPWLRRRLDSMLEDGSKSQAFRIYHRLYAAADSAKLLLLTLTLWRIAG